MALAAFGILLGASILAPVPAVSAQPARDEISYVLMKGDTESSMMSGSMDDLHRARDLRAGREGLLYVRQGAAAYVIRDVAMLRRVDALFAPQNAIGERRAGLSDRRSALSRQLAELRREARLLDRQASPSPDRARLLARRQAALDDQRDAIDRQRDTLSRERDRVRQIAMAQLRALVADAVRDGIAQRVD